VDVVGGGKFSGEDVGADEGQAGTSSAECRIAEGGVAHPLFIGLRRRWRIGRSDLEGETRRSVIRQGRVDIVETSS
jgi:hypothetical protein